jgi:DNA-binding CsgD family transcriptional regulator
MAHASMSRFQETWLAYWIGHGPPDSRAALFLNDTETDTYVLRASCGCPELVSAAGPIALVLARGERGGHVGLVAAAQRTSLVTQCAQDPLWSLPAVSYEAALLVPFSVPAGPEGVVVFFASTARDFNDYAIGVAKRLVEFIVLLCVTTSRAHALEHHERRAATLGHLAQASPIRRPAPGIVDEIAPFPGRFSDDHLTWNLGPNPGASLSQRMAGLSPRELEVLHVFREQRRINGISDTLKISPHTVRNHLKSIFQKLGVHSQVELLAAVGPKREGTENSENLARRPSNLETPEF